MTFTSQPIDERFRAIRSLLVAVAVATTLSSPSLVSEAAADGPVRSKRSSSRVNADASPVYQSQVRQAGQRPPARRVAEQPRLVQTTARSPVSSRPQETQSSEIEQVGFLEDYGRHANTRHNSACDCGECGSIYLQEPACGMEYEVACGAEPVCGFESYGGPCDCDRCVSAGRCDSFGGDSYGGELACDIDCFPLFLPIMRIDWSRFEFFWGTQAYHNPLNDPATGATSRADSGSFGFHQGFNEGRNLRPWLGLDLAAQFGLRATQSNIHNETFTDQQRNQIFLTGGLFRRVDYGLQYGVVLDYLNEDWYYHSDLLQLRGELSWKMSACHNFGFHWMAGVNDKTIDTMVRSPTGTLFNSTAKITASNQYRAFYRMTFGATGEWTSFIGGTDDDHLILGSELDVPLKSGLSLQVGSTYFAPGDQAGYQDHVAEGWNLGISVVYRPGSCRPGNRYGRPMFDVADNGSFFVFGR